jgi:hypothetical protein
MSVMVLIRFPCPHAEVVAWAEKNGALLAPIGQLFEKHGRIGQRVILGENEFIDLDEWPSREAYAAFKAEAGPHIEAFESSFGHRSVDTVYDIR